jgi:ring-1,2-phenylacetyl-CoA epoxidase subunit PaaC
MTGLNSHKDFLLAIADDKHFIGQQHAEWIGVTPFLEEDLAFCSIGQDELGHAALVYELLSGAGDTAIDSLAFGRPHDEFRSCWLTEYVTTDWSQALVRHWMFDTADALRWELLANSSSTEIREIAAIVEREEVYHRLHANALLDALLSDDLASQHIGAAAQKIAPLCLGLFDPVSGEAAAIEAAVATGAFGGQLEAFKTAAGARFGDIDWGTAPNQGGRTVRSASFAPLLARMREVIDFDPQAIW